MRKTRKQGDEPVGEPTEVPAEEMAAATPPDEPAPEAVPAPRPRRARKTATPAEPTEEAAADAASEPAQPAPPADVEPAEPDAPAPAKPARRARKAAAPSDAAEPAAQTEPPADVPVTPVAEVPDEPPAELPDAVELMAQGAPAPGGSIVEPEPAKPVRGKRKAAEPAAPEEEAVAEPAPEPQPDVVAPVPDLPAEDSPWEAPEPPAPPRSREPRTYHLDGHYEVGDVVVHEAWADQGEVVAVDETTTRINMVNLLDHGVKRPRQFVLDPVRPPVLMTVRFEKMGIKRLAFNLPMREIERGDTDGPGWSTHYRSGSETH